MYIDVKLSPSDLKSVGHEHLHPSDVNLEMFRGLSKHMIRKADIITYEKEGYIFTFKERRRMKKKPLELIPYNVECYFKNPETGELGWSIEIVRVVSINKSDAANIIKAMPYFDCFIEDGFGRFNYPEFYRCKIEFNDVAHPFWSIIKTRPFTDDDELDDDSIFHYFASHDEFIDYVRKPWGEFTILEYEPLN